MSITVNSDKCLGCEKCVEICPGNLLVLDKDKACIRHPQDCWDCMACVKVCPEQALETKLPYQLAGYKASLKPTVFTDRIEWELTDLHGQKEHFTIKRLEF